jgi:hypothetical protein
MSGYVFKCSFTVIGLREEPFLDTRNNLKKEVARPE